MAGHSPVIDVCVLRACLLRLAACALPAVCSALWVCIRAAPCTRGVTLRSGDVPPLAATTARALLAAVSSFPRSCSPINFPISWMLSLFHWPFSSNSHLKTHRGTISCTGSDAPRSCCSPAAGPAITRCCKIGRSALCGSRRNAGDRQPSHHPTPEKDGWDCVPHLRVGRVTAGSHATAAGYSLPGYLARGVGRLAGRGGRLFVVRHVHVATGIDTYKFREQV